MRKPSNVEIFQWLEKKDYQNSLSDMGEYTLYYELDMPTILNDYYNWRVKRSKK